MSDPILWIVKSTNPDEYPVAFMNEKDARDYAGSAAMCLSDVEVYAVQLLDRDHAASVIENANLDADD